MPIYIYDICDILISILSSSVVFPFVGIWVVASLARIIKNILYGGFEK